MSQLHFYYKLIKRFFSSQFVILELRKQARQLENDIDVNLVAFSKLGVSSGSSQFSSENVPLINSDDMFDTLSMELQQMLKKVFIIKYMCLYS